LPHLESCYSTYCGNYPKLKELYLRLHGIPEFKKKLASLEKSTNRRLMVDLLIQPLHQIPRNFDLIFVSLFCIF